MQEKRPRHPSLPGSPETSATTPEADNVSSELLTLDRAAEVPVDAISIGAFMHEEELVHVHAYVNLPARANDDGSEAGVRVALSFKPDGVKAYPATGNAFPTKSYRKSIRKRGTSMHSFAQATVSAEDEPKSSPYALGVHFLAPTKDNPAGSVLIHSKDGSIATDADRSVVPTIETAAPPVMHPIEQNVNQLLAERNRAYLRKEKVRTVGINTIIGLGLFAALKSGSVVDLAIDPLQEAGVATQSILKDPVYNDGLTTQQKQQLAAGGSKHEQYVASVDRVADVMQKWDDGDIDAIRAQADEFAQKHADQLMSSEATTKIHERLDQAKTNQDALEAMNDFMRFYGKDAQFLKQDFADSERFDPETGSLDDLRSFGAALVDSLSPLPKSIIEKADFRHVILGAKGESHFYYTGNALDGKSIVYNVGNFTGIYNVNEVVESLEPTERSHIILHELGHTLNERNDYEEQPTMHVFHYLVGRAINMPGEQSFYAASHTTNEAMADNIAVALNVKGHFSVVSPNAVRAFNSGANAEALAVLTRFETQLSEEGAPGFASYMVNQKLED